MKLTQKQKIETFDTVESARQKFELAVYDMVNHKFGIAKTYTSKRIREEFESTYDGYAFTVAMSWRGNPLFLVRCLQGDRIHSDVWTETEIQDNYRTQQHGWYWRIVMHARNELVQEHMRKEQAA